MKQYAGMMVNVAKTIKAGEDDTNEEGIYAELNVLVQETKYELSNAKDIVRTKKIDEVEIMITASGARDMSKALLDIAERMDVAEELEKEKDIAHKEWIEENKG